MKHLRWLSVAVAGCSLSLAQADDLAPSPAAARLVPIKTSEALAKPIVVHETSTGLSGTDVAIPEGEVVQSDVVYSTPFFDAVAGLKCWFMERTQLPVLRSWAGAETPLLSGDVEDPYWLKFELLWGWFKPYHVPPMLTTSVPQSSLGILGNPGTQVLFGGEDLDLQTHLGSRATFGFWLEPSQAWGFETSYFFFGNRTSGVQLRSNGSQLLAQPFFDVLNNTQNSIPIANEDIPEVRSAFSGYVDLHTTSRLQGVNVLALNNSIRGTSGRLDWAWGYRYLRLDEGLHNLIVQVQPPAQGQARGTRIFAYDEFATENSFHGFDVGVRTQWWWGCWSLDVNGRLAIGATRGMRLIQGQTLVDPPNGPDVISAGGVYALSSNMGEESRVSFAVVPEIEIGIGYHFYDHCRLTLMYNFLAWTQVFRPGDQVDTNINPNLFSGESGGPIAPLPISRTSTFYLNGLSLGLEIRY